MISIRERLYIETDGSCANCGFKDSRALSIHHIEKSKPKNEAYDNKILLCYNCHQTHGLGKGPSTEDLKKLKRQLIMKTLTPLGLNAMKEAYRKGLVVATPFLVNHLIELRYLEQVDTISSFSTDDGKVVDVDCTYSLTSEGRKLLDTWKLK